MNRLVFVLVTVIGLASCASHYETDKTNPSYQRGDYFPLNGLPSVQVATPEGTVTAQTNTPYGGEAAVVGLLASSIALAANRDYYRKTGITGKCICGVTEKDSIQLPCNQVSVIITDRKGKELARTQTTDGEFAFRVKDKYPYRLKIESTQYQPTKKIDRDFYFGEDIVLMLTKKTP